MVGAGQGLGKGHGDAAGGEHLGAAGPVFGPQVERHGGVVFQGLAFVVEPKAEGQREAGGQQVVDGGLVEEGDAAGGGAVGAGVGDAVVEDGQLDGHGDAVENGLEDVADAVFLEDDVAVGGQGVVEAEEADGPFVAAVFADGAKDELLVDGVLALPLVDGEDALAGEVLIHGHVVVEPLVAGVGGELEAVGEVFEPQGVVAHPAAVVAGVVVVYRGDFSALFVVEAVGEGVLVGEVEPAGEHGFQAGGDLPFEFQTAAGGLAAVGFSAGELIGEVAAVAVVVGADAQAGSVAEAGEFRYPGLPVAVAAAADGEAVALVFEGGKGVDVDDAAHGVPTVEGTLGAAEDFDALDVEEVEVEGGFVHVGDVVDVEADALAAAPGADAAQVDGGGHPGAVVGDEEVGNEGAEVFDGFDLAVVDPGGGDEGNGFGKALKGVGLFGGGADDDLFGFDGAGGVAVFGVREEREGAAQQQKE